MTTTFIKRCRILRGNNFIHLCYRFYFTLEGIWEEKDKKNFIKEIEFGLL